MPVLKTQIVRVDPRRFDDTPEGREKRFETLFKGIFDIQEKVNGLITQSTTSATATSGVIPLPSGHQLQFFRYPVAPLSLGVRTYALTWPQPFTQACYFAFAQLSSNPSATYQTNTSVEDSSLTLTGGTLKVSSGVTGLSVSFLILAVGI